MRLPLVVAGSSANTFAETGSMRLSGMMLLGKGLAVPAFRSRVRGSNISLAKIELPWLSLAGRGPAGTPSLGLKLAPPLGEIAEKSPMRKASVGNVVLKVIFELSRNSSQLKKKKLLLRPL